MEDQLLMRFHRNRMAPRLASDKFFCLIRCDSYLEKDFFIQLDFDPAVIAWRDHPFQILYLHAGRFHRYTPDAFILRRVPSGLIRQVVEVKSTQLLQKDEVARTLEVGARFCGAKGWEYRVVTEEEIRSGCLLENVKRIRRYRQRRPPLRDLLVLRELLNARGGWAPIAEVAHAFEDIGGGSAIPSIYSTLYHKELFADLRAPLTRDTLVGLVPFVEGLDPLHASGYHSLPSAHAAERPKRRVPHLAERWTTHWIPCSCPAREEDVNKRPTAGLPEGRG